MTNSTTPDAPEAQGQHLSESEMQYLFPRGKDTPEDISLPRINKLMTSRRHVADEKGNQLSGGIDDGDFHTIALLKTNSGKFYLATNMNTGEAVERPCAERRAIDKMLEDNTNAKVNEVWVMGAKDEKGTIKDGYENKRCCPCGSCLSIINKHSESKETKVHMLPANDGSKDIAYASAGVKSQFLTDKHAETREISELLPNDKLVIKDKSGAMKDIINKGNKALLQKEDAVITTPQERAQLLHNVRDFENNSVDFHKLNKFMIESALQTYAQQDTDPAIKGKIQEVTVAVVRAADGTLHSYAGNKSEMQSTTPSAIFGAIMDMTDSNVAASAQATDMWEMKFNPANVATQQEEWEQNPKADIIIAAPRGDALERAKKFSNNLQPGVVDAQGERIKSNKLKQGCRICVIPVNDGSPEASEEIEKTMKEQKLWLKMSKFLPFAFSNPKQIEQQLSK